MLSKYTIEKKIVLGITCVLAVLLLNALISYQATKRVIHNNQRVIGTQNVITQLESVLSIVTDAETGQRGYIITGQLPYLKPYRDAVRRAFQSIKVLKQMLGNQPRQQAQLRIVEQASRNKLAELNQTVGVRKAQGFAPAYRIVLSGRGRLEMDRLRAAIFSLQKAEQGELERRIAYTRSSQKQATFTFVIANLVACIFLFLVGFVILRDATARRRAEQEISEQRELLRVTLASIGDGVITTDDEGRVTFLNSVAESLTGWKSPEAAGVPLEKVFPILNETTRQAVDNPALRAIREGVIVGLANHTILVARNSSETPIDDSGAPIRDAAGENIIGAVLVFRDVTERKKIEDEREQLLRTEQNARTEAEAASRSKDEFLAVVSHELRTPLQAMLGWTNLLRSGRLDEESQSTALETIERNARAQSQLIEDILEVSRITTGKLHLEIKPVELDSVINNVLEAVRPSASSKDIAVEYQPDENAGLVSGDSNRLQQVIWNLVANAIKFTPKGGHVRINLQRRDSNVEVAISDDGKGIDSNFLPHVFEQFRQDDGSSTRRYGGLGLGLSIVKHLVELHGGTVSAYSEGEGHGSTFRILLPQRPIREDIQTKAEVEPAGDRENYTGQAVALDGLKLIVVDDETDTRELLVALLRQQGAEVRPCNSPTEVLELLSHWKADVLISDVGMPGEDGYSLISKIRARTREQGGAIPAIALTAYARTEDRVRALSAGFQMHIPKPVEAAELTIVIASLAGRSVAPGPKDDQSQLGVARV